MPTRVPCAAHRLFALALLAAPAVAQMGRRNTGGDPRAGGQADVDMAMAGWEQLSQNPDKMAEVMASLQDPEVAAKAQEMLKDPEYMRAAKAKVAELQAKAQQNGLLDANGQPVPNNMANMMAQMGLGNGGVNLWGYGSYFARDASYSVHAGYCEDCRDDDQNRMVLLCLVECGLSCVGEEHMKVMPKTHPERKLLPYMSYVDYASNPEIFVVDGQQAYPAYIIHFD